MKLSQYGYDFSPEMLAKYPAENRDEARLMVVNRKTGAIEHSSPHASTETRRKPARRSKSSSCAN